MPSPFYRKAVGWALVCRGVATFLQSHVGNKLPTLRIGNGSFIGVFASVGFVLNRRVGTLCPPLPRLPLMVGRGYPPYATLCKRTKSIPSKSSAISKSRQLARSITRPREYERPSKPVKERSEAKRNLRNRKETRDSAGFAVTPFLRSFKRNSPVTQPEKHSNGQK